MLKLQQIRDELYEYQATLEKYREYLFDAVGPVINELQRLLAESLNLVKLHFDPVVILKGAYTTAKSSWLSRFMRLPLPSGAMPTSRIFALVCPTKGASRATYSVLHLGISEVRSLLRLLAEHLHEDVTKHAKTIVRKPIHPKVMAKELLDLILEKINSRFDVAHRRILAEAAFLCRSVCEHFNTDEKTAWSEELKDTAYQSAAEKAEQFLSWGVEADVAALIYKPGEPTSKQALQQELDDWFIKKSRLNTFRQSPNFDQIKERYDITLRLATIGYVQINEPQNDALAQGLVWVDSPGHGASLHDTIKAQVCTESAIGGIAFVNLQRPWGNEDDNVVADLKSRGSLNAIAFTFADDPLAGKLNEHLNNLANAVPQNAQHSLQTILAEFASLTSISREDSIVRQWLQSDNPNEVSRVLLCCPVFGLPDKTVVTDICKKALPLARFLRDASTLKNLPEHLQQLVNESDADGLSPLPFPEIQSLPPIVAQRLTALLFALASDGGMSHAGTMFGFLNESLNAGVDPRIARLQGILEKLRDLIAKITVGEQGAVRVQLPPKLERVVRDVVQHVSELTSAFLKESNQNVPVRRLLEVPHRICKGNEPVSNGQGNTSAAIATVVASLPAGDPKVMELIKQLLQGAGGAPAIASTGILPKQLKIASQELVNEGPNRTLRDVARERFKERFIDTMLGYIQPEVADEIVKIEEEYEVLLTKHFEPVLVAAAGEKEAEAKAFDSEKLLDITTEMLIDFVNHQHDRRNEIGRLTMQIAEAIKFEQETAQQTYWRNPLNNEPAQTDAMASLSDELFNPQFHVDQFCQVAEFLVKCRLGIVFVNAVRESVLRIKTLLIGFAREIEKAYSYDRLSGLLTKVINDSPGMREEHDRREAKNALHDVLVESPALLEGMIDELATRHQPHGIPFSRNSNHHKVKQSATAVS